MSKIRFHKDIVHKIGRLYCREVCRREYVNTPYPYVSERMVEFSFVLRQIVRAWPLTVLDVGPGTTALPHLIQNCGYRVTAIDNIKDYWKHGMFNRHFYVIDDDITRTKLDKKFDFISCISTLEHIKNHDAAVDNMFSLLNPGGHLVITCPYSENTFVEDVFRLPGVGFGQDFYFICQMFSRNEVDGWLQRNNAIILEQEYWRHFTGKYWAFGEMLNPPLKVEKSDLHQLTCILFQKRS